MKHSRRSRSDGLGIYYRRLARHRCGLRPRLCGGRETARRDKAEALAAETGALALCADSADKDAVESAVKTARESLGAIDTVVCNAGIAHYGLISEITPDAWRRIFAVNVDGIFHCVRAALPGMLQKQAGAIVAVSSMWGQVGASCEAAYSATKGAVLALSKALAQELGPSGIRVNAICPGVIQTDMCANVAQDVMESLREQTPIEKLGRPEDVAQAMAYLIDAPFVTGQGLNGGFVIT